jgi:predicted metal-dependent hydrolase
MRLEQRRRLPPVTTLRHDATDDEILERLERDARELAGHFRLPLTRIAKEDARVKRRYGSCDDKGVIRIRLRNCRNGNPLKYSSLVATLCHEMAHLVYMNHGLRFQGFYARILSYARENRIYRPRAVPPRGKTSSKRAALDPPAAGPPPGRPRQPRPPR